MFGLSDGLVSNTALLLGMSSGQANPETLVLAGIAGLLAGAGSMAAGEWISMATQREALMRELHRERSHLDRYPADERAHLIALLGDAGLSEQTAERVAKELEAQPTANLDFHARLELGIDPDELGSPARAAIASFVAFALGALVPLLPWLLRPEDGVPATILLSAAALFLSGALLSRFTPLGPLRSGARQLLVGSLAAALTMAIGALIGVQG